MKNYIPIVAVGVIAFIFFGAYIFMQKSSSKIRESQPAENKSSANNPSNNLINSNQKYIEFSANVPEQNKEKRRVLFFYANWCPTCRPADADFNQNSEKIPVDVVVIRVNYNDDQTDEDEKAIAAKYGVTYQHTFVQINTNGEEVTKWNGGKTSELLTKIK